MVVDEDESDKDTIIIPVKLKQESLRKVACVIMTRLAYLNATATILVKDNVSTLKMRPMPKVKNPTRR
jgi:hypothetical protein